LSCRFSLLHVVLPKTTAWLAAIYNRFTMISSHHSRIGISSIGFISNARHPNVYRFDDARQPGRRIS
jgi:hypothetical protein